MEGERAGEGACGEGDGAEVEVGGEAVAAGDDVGDYEGGYRGAGGGGGGGGLVDVVDVGIKY